MPIAPNGTWIPYTVANETSWYGLFRYANSVTDNYFGMSFLFLVFIVSFIAMRRYPTKDGFAVSSFITTVLGVLMKMIGLIGDEMILLFTIITAASVLMLFKETIVSE